MNTPTNQSRRIIPKEFIFLLALSVLALFMLGLFSNPHTGTSGFHSSEVKFSDSSREGLSIVPASCPSSPDYAGECGLSGCPDGYTLANGACVITSCPAGFTLQNGLCHYTAGSSCTRQTICFRGSSYRQNPNCSLTLVQQCAYACTSATGLCSVPVPSIVTWRLSPSLVQRGNTTNVTWQADNVESCTVTGSNGDTWSGASGARPSGPITERTTYTLVCNGLSGAVPASLTQTAVVNIAPIFQEQ